MSKKSFGSYLECIQYELGMTRNELATKIGISNTQLGKIIRGRANMRVETFNKIVSKLELDRAVATRELLGED